MLLTLKRLNFTIHLRYIRPATTFWNRTSARLYFPKVAYITQRHERQEADVRNGILHSLPFPERRLRQRRLCQMPVEDRIESVVAESASLLMPPFRVLPSSSSRPLKYDCNWK